MLSVIAAQDLNGAIGRENAMPWHVPEDFQFFKRQTMGATVIMGHRTWESLPRRPLPGRENIVVSRRIRGCVDGAVFTDLEGALRLARAQAGRPVFCMGGAQIYRQMLPLADRVLLSTIALRIEGADAFFPPLPPSEWQCVSRAELRAEAPACFVKEFRRIAGTPATGPTT